jgi:(p)ppGpp synthase/HD superfamily hydrolase
MPESKLHDTPLTYAIKLAAEIHDGQQDKAGEEYILHALAVMQMVAPERNAMIVAVLHDTVEDTNPGNRPSVRYRIREYFGDTIATSVEALTHAPGETYSDYIERIAEDYLATKVKIADLTHNMDPRRIPATQIVDKDFHRWDKYRKALIRLERGPNG